ncbi:hypothetical protein Tco_1110572 [Tanacetum coccineum]|uniref:Uncharacterized protein n=1 Tax=Tanacetum coccineum TaxID=301880 RepID=A0ABQ5IJ68_9ASTR
MFICLAYVLGRKYRVLPMRPPALLCIQCRVHDEMGTVSMNGKFDETPTDFNGILGNKYAFKINMDEWQSMKLSPSLTFHNVFGDPQIINVLMPMVTPLKGETNDAAMKDTIVLLDTWLGVLCTVSIEVATDGDVGFQDTVDNVSHRAHGSDLESDWIERVRGDESGVCVYGVRRAGIRGQRLTVECEDSEVEVSQKDISTIRVPLDTSVSVLSIGLQRTCVDALRWSDGEIVNQADTVEYDGYCVHREEGHSLELGKGGRMGCTSGGGVLVCNERRQLLDIGEVLVSRLHAVRRVVTGEICVTLMTNLMEWKVGGVVGGAVVEEITRGVYLQLIRWYGGVGSVWCYCGGEDIVMVGLNGVTVGQRFMVGMVVSVVGGGMMGLGVGVVEWGWSCGKGDLGWLKFGYRGSCGWVDCGVSGSEREGVGFVGGGVDLGCVMVGYLYCWGEVSGLVFGCGVVVGGRIVVGVGGKEVSVVLVDEYFGTRRSRSFDNRSNDVLDME